MSVVIMSALDSLGRATAGVTVMAIAISLLLRLFPLRSPAIQRFTWLLVLLPGIVVWRMSVVLPILPAAPCPEIDPRAESEIDFPNSVAAARVPPLTVPNDETSFVGTPQSLTGVWACAVVLGAWLAGMIVLAVRWAWSYLAFARGLPPPLPRAAGWLAELHDVCEQLSLPHPIPLHVTDRLGPALCLTPGGYRLLVPSAAWGRFSALQRRSILRHELAHYLRGDLWKSLIARLLAWPQWFNPLAWLAVRQFEEAAECACDDAAIAAAQGDAFDYLRALLELGTTDLSTPTLHAAVHGGSLQSRVRRLLSPTGKDSVMKKLVVIVAALTLATGGFARIRLASAQSPAPPSSESPAPAASGNAGAAAAQESPALDSEDSARVATATPARPNPEKHSQEAYLNLTRVFKELLAFQQQMSAIKDQIQQFDREHKEEQARLTALSEELRAASDSERRLQLEKELADGKAKLQTQTAEHRQHLLQEEAKLYNAAYDQIRSEVAAYAKEHGIRRVTRSELIAFADEKVDGADRQAVLQRVNRPILYLTGPSESPTDITNAILQRLNGAKTR